MPTTRVETHHCSTDWSGWLNDAHPTMEDGEVSGTFCFSERPLSTPRTFFKFSTKVVVKNCGSYFIYKLVPLTNCESRYCATD